MTFRSSPRFVAVLALFVLAAACAPTIPAVSVARDAPAAPAELPLLLPCLIAHDEHERSLALAVDGEEGSWPLVIGTIVIPHPRGVVLLDPGLGRDVHRDLARAPPWFRLVMGEGETIRPLDSELRRLGIPAHSVREVLVTHAHWDHVGGLRDLPNARASLSEDELAWARSLRGRVDHGAMPGQLEREGGKLRGYSFDGPPRWGFEASHDVLGDGSIVAVPLPGHTPGSAGYVVSSRNGSRWLFVGDAVWAREGIERPAPKGALARGLVDGDREATARTIGRLHAVAATHPELQIVVSHDRRTLGEIAPCSPLVR